MNPACDGKERFTTRAMAEMVAKRSRRRSNDRVQAYRCQACGAYHVGSGGRAQTNLAVAA